MWLEYMMVIVLRFAWPDAEYLLTWRSTHSSCLDLSRDMMTMLCRSKHWDPLGIVFLDMLVGIFDLL